MRSATLIAVLSCLLAVVGCGGNNNSNCDPVNGCTTSLVAMCSPMTMQSGGTSQCTDTRNCSGRACSQVPSWSASAGSISVYGGLFTAPQTDATLDVTITATDGGDVATTTIVVNP